MQPTLYTNDFCLVEHLSAHPWRVRKAIQKNDLVLFRALRDPQTLICKRVVAVEGDDLPESSSISSDFDMLTVPLGHCWIEGDNPAVSLDSRDYGPVPYGLVYGRIIFRLWPNFRIF